MTHFFRKYSKFLEKSSWHQVKIVFDSCLSAMCILSIKKNLCGQCPLQFSAPEVQPQSLLPHPISSQYLFHPFLNSQVLKGSRFPCIFGHSIIHFLDKEKVLDLQAFWLIKTFFCFPHATHSLLGCR